MAEEENGEVEGWEANNYDSASATIIAEKIKPFLKITTDCGINDSNGACFHKGLYKLKNGGNYINPSTDNKSYKVKLLNGVAFSISAYPDGKTSIVFGIDVNGKNLPNKSGIDHFLFRYENHSLRPSGAPDSTYPYEKHCKNKDSTGWGCAYWVVMNKNMSYLHNK